MQEHAEPEMRLCNITGRQLAAITDIELRANIERRQQRCSVQVMASGGQQLKGNLERRSTQSICPCRCFCTLHL